MAPGRRRVRIAQHAGDFQHPLLTFDKADIARRDAASCPLGDRELSIGARGDLRQMGDDERLARGRGVAPRDLCQRLAHP
ncbi:MAG: hypothetical protein ACREMF_10595, partial [Gemmatimonadales bacterium]